MTHRLKGMRALRGLKKEVANSSKGIDIMRDEELDRTMKSSLEYLARLKQEQSMRLSQLVNRASTPQRARLHRLLKKHTAVSNRLRTLIGEVAPTLTSSLEKAKLCQQVRSLSKSARTIEGGIVSLSGHGTQQPQGQKAA